MALFYAAHAPTLGLAVAPSRAHARHPVACETPGILVTKDTPLEAATPDELDLAQRAADGDRQAAELLLRSALPRVRNLVRYLVRGDGDVDDIAQEALVAILRGLNGYRGEGSFRSWSDRIVARATFAYLKRTRLRDRRQQAVGGELKLVTIDHADEDLPGQLAARREAAHLLDQLPEEQRSVLVLHHIMGLGVAEIASELNTPFETIRSRLRLAKGRLRALRQEGECHD